MLKNISDGFEIDIIIFIIYYVQIWIQFTVYSSGIFSFN